MNRSALSATTLLFALTSCSDSILSTSESFIDAFYSFDANQLNPFLVNAQESAPAITFYQGWAEGGNYKVLNRRACESVDANTVQCSITVEDDPIMALGIDFKVTDTFTITFEDAEITAVETSSDDPPLYFAARDWVRENRAELIETPCQGIFAGGPTPGDCARAMSEGYAQFAASRIASEVDHLVFAVADLESGMDLIEETLGVRPVLGGRHPNYGTHNALLGLGESVFLEIIAPDYSLDRPAQGRLFGLDNIDDPEMRTWALRREEIAIALDAADGTGIGPIESGSRERPDGAVLNWRLTDPYAMPNDGAVPFLISWGETPHPAASIPIGGQLTKVSIIHPDTDEVRSALELLNLNVEVSAGDSFELIAEIQTVDGTTIELR